MTKATKGADTLADKLLAEAGKLSQQWMTLRDGRSSRARALRRQHDLMVLAAMWILGAVEGRKKQ